MGACYPIQTFRVPTYPITTIEFTSIPQTYRHLEIFGQFMHNTNLRADRAYGGFTVQLNSNTSSTWTMEVWNGQTNSGTATIANDDYNHLENWSANGRVGLASCAGVRFYMNDYSSAGTNKNLNFQSHGYISNADNYSGYMYNGDKYGCESMDGAITDAVTGIKIIAAGINYFTANSEVTLYGLDNA